MSKITNMISPAATPPIREPLATEDAFEGATDAVVSAGEETDAAVGAAIPPDGEAVTTVCTMDVVVVVHVSPPLLPPVSAAGEEDAGTPAGPPSSQMAVVAPADWVGSLESREALLMQPR